MCGSMVDIQSATAEIRRGKKKKEECGPMSNVMAALAKIGGAVGQRCKVWLTPTTRVPCRNAAKTQNPLKCAGVLETPEPVSAVSGPKFTILRGHMYEVLLFNKFFSVVDTCRSCEDTAQQICAMVPRWQFFGDCLRTVFPASRVQYISDLHSKFALKPHHVWKYGRHPVCDR